MAAARGTVETGATASVFRMTSCHSTPSAEVTHAA
jgi:hypothetical protein